MEETGRSGFPLDSIPEFIFYYFYLSIGSIHQEILLFVLTIFDRAAEIIREGKPAVLCIVVDSGGSTPGKLGAKMIVQADGSVSGTIGGGAIEKEVTEQALTMIGSSKPVTLPFDLGGDLAMHCGGRMQVYLEPLNPARKLYIFGAGHIGRALAPFSRDLGFAVTLIDPRSGIFTDEAYSNFTCINRDYFEAIREITFDDHSYLVIVTPKHLYDEDILAVVARKPHAYLGMIGSRTKVALLRKRFLAENILTEEELDRIDMPIGIPFRAETPHEIAISILAKMIDTRNAPVDGRGKTE